MACDHYHRWESDLDKRSLPQPEPYGSPLCQRASPRNIGRRPPRHRQAGRLPGRQTTTRPWSWTVRVSRSKLIGSPPRAGKKTASRTTPLGESEPEASRRWASKAVLSSSATAVSSDKFGFRQGPRLRWSLRRTATVYWRSGCPSPRRRQLPVVSRSNAADKGSAFFPDPGKTSARILASAHANGRPATVCQWGGCALH